MVVTAQNVSQGKPFYSSNTFGLIERNVCLVERYIEYFKRKKKEEAERTIKDELYIQR